MSDQVDFNAIARATSGASGAELANIINEAALRAVRQGRDTVEQEDLEESVEVVIAGYQRKNAVISEKEKRIVAYHEIGHALAAARQSTVSYTHLEPAGQGPHRGGSLSRPLPDHRLRSLHQPRHQHE